jgi:hypothetical protein
LEGRSERVVVGEELPTRELKSILALRAKVREGPGGSGWTARVTTAPSGIRARGISLLSVAEREKISSCRREEKGNRLIEKTGMLEEEVGQQEIQKWSAR